MLYYRLVFIVGNADVVRPSLYTFSRRTARAAGHYRGAFITRLASADQRPAVGALLL